MIYKIIYKIKNQNKEICVTGKKLFKLRNQTAIQKLNGLISIIDNDDIINFSEIANDTIECL